MADQAPQSKESERPRSDDDCGCRGPRGASAQDILDRRYASGEITRDQYEQMKGDLGSSRKTDKKGCC